MDPKVRKMLNQKYEVKADIKRSEEVKEPTVAISPSGNQYSNNIMARLRLFGLDSIKEAKKAGWRFK